MLTVRELIEKLSEMPDQDATVVTEVEEETLEEFPEAVAEGATLTAESVVEGVGFVKIVGSLSA